jgi:hypothetical protein
MEDAVSIRMRLCFVDNILDVLERDPFFRTNGPMILPSFMALCVRHMQQAYPQDTNTKHFDMVLSRVLRLMLPCILVTVLKPRTGGVVIVFHTNCKRGGCFVFVS